MSFSRILIDTGLLVLLAALLVLPIGSVRLMNIQPDSEDNVLSVQDEAVEVEESSPSIEATSSVR
jgi:hypothetical protein